jgi:uncharacterized OB-fold protein
LTETQPFTIESFYKFVGEGKLMAAKCSKCGTTLLPPRPVCNKCFSKDLEWVKPEGNGNLLTYTVIHIPPVQFQSMAPYAVGVVELKEGLRLPGMIRGVEPEKIRVGMTLTIDFEKTTQSQWPLWPRYFFRPL